MIELARQNIDGQPKKRQREIEQRLAEFGFARGPRHVLVGAGVAEFEHTRVRRFRLMLESLGPIFSAFGLYLSTRADLLPVRDCVELAAIADHASPASFSFVQETLRHQIGYPLERVYGTFEETPFETRLLFQSYYAWLDDGSPVVVKMLRPGIVEQVACDTHSLSLLKNALAWMGLRSETVDGVLADFGDSLRWQMNLLHEAEAIKAMARSAEECEMLLAPALHTRLCTQGVLTVERLPGLHLDGLLNSSTVREEDETKILMHAEWNVDRRQLARMLSLVWLRQALHDQLFPIEPHASNVMIVSDRRIAFTGGTFAGLAPEQRANLWDYLVAAAADNPDRACSSLLREMKTTGRSDRGGDLPRRFKQLVPEREGQWSNGNDNLADYLIEQWRLVGLCGYVPQEHVASFYRGLFAITCLTRQLAPESDALAEGIQEMRLLVSLGQMREMMKFRELENQMDTYAALMVNLPQRLDEALTLAAEGGARVRFQLPTSVERRRRKNSSMKLTALLLVLAAFVLWTHNPATALAGPWADGVRALVFVALGALVLRAVIRA